MKNKRVALVGALAGVMMATSVLAANDDCLQNNRLWAWKVINERTLVITDISKKKFTVSMSGGCVGLTNSARILVLRTATNLGCLRNGDRVSFRAPALGRQSCIVTDVQPEASAPAR